MGWKLLRACDKNATKINKNAPQIQDKGAKMMSRNGLKQDFYYAESKNSNPQVSNPGLGACVVGMKERMKRICLFHSISNHAHGKRSSLLYAFNSVFFS